MILCGCKAENCSRQMWGLSLRAVSGNIRPYLERRVNDSPQGLAGLVLRWRTRKGHGGFDLGFWLSWRICEPGNTVEACTEQKVVSV